MKNPFYILTIIYLACCLTATAQKAGDDKNNESSVLLPVGNVAFTTKDSKLEINYTYGTPWLFSSRYLNSYRHAADIPKPQRLFFNVKGNTSNSAGSGAFFSKGYIVPTTELSGIIGWKINKPRFGSDQASYKMSRETNENRQEMINSNKKLNQTEIGNMAQKMKDTTLQKTMIRFSKTENDSIALILIDTIKAKIKSEPNDTEQSRLYLQVSIQMDSCKNRLERNKGIAQAIETTYKNIKNFSDKNNCSKLIYLGGERFSRSFYLFNPSFSAFNDRYKKRTFAGGSFFVGANVYKILDPDATYKKCLVAGVRVDRELTDNYSSLETFEVESTTTFTDSNRTDKQSKKILVSEQANLYHSYYQYRVYADAMIFLQLDSAFIGFGAYYRGNFVEKNDWDNKNTWSWGLNTSFFNRKGVFSGGIFAELPGPKATTDNRYWYNRVTVGITTKINFKSFDFAKLFAD